MFHLTHVQEHLFDSSVELTIKKANFKINLIEPQNNTFISTVRQKLMWGSDKKKLIFNLLLERKSIFVKHLF